MKSPGHRDAFLKEGLVCALSRDKVKAVSALLQKGASVEVFNVGKRLCFAAETKEEVKKKALSPEAQAVFGAHIHVNMLSKKQYMKATAEWQKLIAHATTPGPGFVTHFSNLRRTVRQDYKWWLNTWWGGKSLFKQGGKLIEQLDFQLVQAFQRYEHCTQPGRPLPKDMRPLLYRRVSQAKKRGKAKTEDEQSDLEHAKNVKELIVLEGVYVHLLGDDFRYRMGIQGPHTDLFFWNILLNRCDLAEVFWMQTMHPVRTAIAAAYLLRKMAKLNFLDHRAAEHMLKNAQHFEDRATEVQQAAERLHTREGNDDDTLRGLNCELELWRGYSLLDLAVESESNYFMETTCRQAIEFRLYGDLNPYTNGTYLGTFKILVGMIPIFWFLPAFDVFQWVEFTPPPTHQAWRRRTQRRIIPEGYPYQPSKNPELKRRIQDLRSRSEPQTNAAPSNPRLIKHEKLLWEVVMEQHGDESRAVKRLSAEQLEKLWAPTFTVLDRLECFLSAPIVLFCLNSFVTIFTNVLFTAWFLNTRVLWPEISLPYIEEYLCMFFGFSLIREFAQLLTERVYFSDIWNFFDYMSILCFFVGYMFKYTLFKHPSWENSSSLVLDTPFWNLLYAFSLFFCWFRVLRVFYMSSMGIPVSIFFKMFHDLGKLTVIWLILIFAFSMLFVGVDKNLAEKNCEAENWYKKSNGSFTEHESENWFSCQKPSYWFSRTIFLSFGEFFLEDMHSYFAILVTMFAFLFVNIMLINLLVATMTSTYESTKQTASLHRLIHRYDLAQESALRAIAVPPIINSLFLLYDFVMFWLHFEAIKELYPECQGLRLFTLYLSRNDRTRISSGGGGTPQPDDYAYQAEAREHLAFMERARALVLEESKQNSLSANGERNSQHSSDSVRSGDRVSLETVVEKLEREKQGLEKELTEFKAALESKTKAAEAKGAAARISELDALLEQQVISRSEYEGQRAAIIASV